MKIIIFFTALLLTFNSPAFSQSVMNFQSGTSIEVQSGANICADSVIVHGTYSGGGTICGVTLYVLSLTAFIQGFYDSFSDTMVSDTISVYFRNANSPYTIIDSSKAALNSSGAGTFNFSNISNGTDYYMVLRHRNSIETWSKTTQIFTANALTYDFSASATQAYGDNMIQVNSSPVRFAIYSGDVNQDGAIDLSDIILIYNDASHFASGYLPTDVNGDNLTDLSDLIITYNNATHFVSMIRP